MNLSNSLVTPAGLLTQEALTSILNSSQENEILENSFSASFDLNGASNWLAGEITTNFSNFPNLEIRPTKEIDYAYGAYATDNNTIYLSAEFVSQNSHNPQRISDVVLEEYGHFLDSRFNVVDTPGDEGALFTNYVQGKKLSKSQLINIRAENDHATIAINNQAIAIEQAKPGKNSAFDLIGLTKLRNDPQYAGIDGSGFSVALIDTGLDTKHPFIAPNYLAGYDFVDNDDDPYDFAGRHGTHVAGTIGATDENFGVAPDVGLIGLRVLDRNGGGSFIKLQKALKWVLENREQYNITAVNISLGTGFYTSESQVRGDILADDIQRLETAGVTVVAAAGNSYVTNSDKSNRANLSYPAISSTIAVGAVWQNNTVSRYEWSEGSIDYSTGADRIASFSQRLDVPNMIFAPGAIISSTVPGSKIGDGGGTSQAAPHVAGSVTLLQEASLKFGGSLLTPEEVNEILYTTGDTVFDGDDEDDNVNNTNTSYSRINIYNAVSEVKRRSEIIVPPSKEKPKAIITHDEIARASTVHRLFRTDIGAHFYTASVTERDWVTSNLTNYVYEGESYLSATATDPITGVKPVYRFLNSNTGVHLYTMSEVERGYINNNLTNYNFEGIAYYGYESDRPRVTPLYRFYNSEIDTHFYTPSVVERDAVLANLPNYQLESNDGIAFYVDPL